MTSQLIILQEAMGAGLPLMLGGGALLLAFMIGYSALFLSYGKKKYLSGSDAKHNQKVTLVYFTSIVLGILTAALTIALILVVYILLIGNISFD